MHDTTLELGSILECLLKRANMSESAFGRKVGIPRATINRIVSGKTPDPRVSTLKSISEYFNVTVDQLLGTQPLSPSETTESHSAQPPIPIIEWSAAHRWAAAIEESKGNQLSWVLTDPESSGGKFAIRIQGESMWPQFQEHTVLIVDPMRIPKNRDFVLVFVKQSESLLFRQLIVDGTYRFAKAINEIFPTIQLQNDDEVTGVVIQTRHNIG